MCCMVLNKCYFCDVKVEILRGILKNHFIKIYHGHSKHTKPDAQRRA